MGQDWLECPNNSTKYNVGNGPTICHDGVAFIPAPLAGSVAKGNVAQCQEGNNTYGDKYIVGRYQDTICQNGTIFVPATIENLGLTSMNTKSALIHSIWILTMLLFIQT